MPTALPSLPASPTPCSRRPRRVASCFFSSSFFSAGFYHSPCSVLLDLVFFPPERSFIHMAPAKGVVCSGSPPSRFMEEAPFLDRCVLFRQDICAFITDNVPAKQHARLSGEGLLCCDWLEKKKRKSWVTPIEARGTRINWYQQLGVLAGFETPFSSSLLPKTGVASVHSCSCGADTQKQKGFLPYRAGSKLIHQRTAGFSPWFHFPRFHFGHLFLTHSHITLNPEKPRLLTEEFIEETWRRQFCRVLGVVTQHVRPYFC